MKQNVLLLPLLGAGLTIFCFILPWINIDLSTIEVDSPFLQFPDSVGSDMPKPKLTGTVKVTGFKLATGSANVLSLSLIAAIAIIVICIYMMIQKTPLNSRLPILICSGIGLLSVLYAVLKNMQIIGLGGYAAGIGFILALLGAWMIPKSAAHVETSDVAET